MVLRDLAALSENDVLELDQPVDRPLELRVSDRKLAQGELMMVGDRVALRLTEVYT
jgi:flagellar motor switch protein FliN/FliY